MSVATLGKIIKGTGKIGFEVAKGTGKLGGKALKEIGKDAAKLGGKLKDVDYKNFGSKVFREIDPEKSNSWIGQHVLPIELSGKAKGVVAGTIAAKTALDAIVEPAMNRAGNIEANIGPLGGMVGEAGVVTPGLVKMQEAAAKGKKGPKVNTNATKYSTHGADGDLVFALHNLR